MREMAEAEKRNSRTTSHILIQLQASEAAIPQVLVTEPALKKDDSQSDEKKLRNKLSKLFSKGKSIDDVKANIDAKVMAYRNYQVNV
jgi:hypothetical protein